MKNLDVQAKDSVELIKEYITKEYSRVIVTFYPAYDKKLHGNLKNKELITSLKKPKKSVFDLKKELYDVVQLIKHKKEKDVDTIKFDPTSKITKWVVTVKDSRKVGRQNFTIPLSKEKAVEAAKKLKYEMSIAIPKYRVFSDISIEPY